MCVFYNRMDGTDGRTDGGGNEFVIVQADITWGGPYRILETMIRHSNIKIIYVRFGWNLPVFVVVIPWSARLSTSRILSRAFSSLDIYAFGHDDEVLGYDPERSLNRFRNLRLRILRVDMLMATNLCGSCCTGTCVSLRNRYVCVSDAVSKKDIMIHLLVHRVLSC